MFMVESQHKETAETPQSVTGKEHVTVRHFALEQAVHVSAYVEQKVCRYKQVQFMLQLEQLTRIKADL